MTAPRSRLGRIPAAALLALPAAAAAAPPAAPRLHTEAHYVMGTVYRITAEVDSDRHREAVRSCFAEARRLDRIFSRYDASSELSRLNRSPAPEPAASADLLRLIRLGLELGRATGGAFDITVGRWTDPLLAAPASASGTPPADARGAVVAGATRVRRPPGTLLDLDGIAKGYAVDGCVGRLRAAGIRRAFVDLGQSSQYAIGDAPGRRGWEVDVRGPLPGTFLGTLRLRDAALSVSSTLREDERGAAIPHIVDPLTGRFLSAPATAVVVAPSAAGAEALSTALLVTAARQPEPLRSLLGTRGAPPAIAAVHAGPAGVQTWHAARVGFAAATAGGRGGVR